MRGTCKGYIQQVQVVDRILQVFVQIVVFINGAAHLLLAIIDGNQRQGTERLVGWSAPQNVRHLQTPVSIGNNHVVELKAFTLMNGQNTDTVGLGALDGLGTDGLIPLADKRVYISGVVLTELCQLVEEGTDIAALVSQGRELEDGKQTLGQFVERHLQQFLSMKAESFRQERAEWRVLSEKLVVGQLFVQDSTMIEFDDGCLCQHVVRMGQQMECLNNQYAGCRAVQTESLVTDNTDLWHLQGEIVGNGWYHAIAAYQDCYLTWRYVLVHQHADCICQLHKYLLLIVATGQQANADQSL